MVGVKVTLDVKLTTADNGGIGNAVDVTDWTLMTIQVGGSGTGTIQFEGSIDGATFFAVGAAVSALGAFNVPFNRLTKLRAKTTVNIAGGPYVATVAGFGRGE